MMCKIIDKWRQLAHSVLLDSVSYAEQRMNIVWLIKLLKMSWQQVFHSHHVINLNRRHYHRTFHSKTLRIQLCNSVRKREDACALEGLKQHEEDLYPTCKSNRRM